ncbi:MAG: bacillithiol biosynthesis deacetylase BshB1 [Pirellulales bacterium]|jgi:N-acetylglucosamine malate deacetylase 1|nr:bacillithiol biosynthesis deacetylase BshB1 [Planctomycetia bacterium]MDO7678544.1 bacillithiol biosynthesis deacetylase BshB1 [Pirellulales bacterium]TSA04702.1 MAG: bacillithiol biosynthesis deacetylase BshB1 [Planctomycetaceae bacterium]
MLDALVIAPHPDDAEIGMGGTIALMQSQSLKVGVLDLTDGEPTPRGSREIRALETAAATKVLELGWRENLGLPNRTLRATLKARASLASVIRRTRPRILFAPYWIDAHPDHVAATRLVEAARFWAKLTKCDLPGEPWHPQRIFYYWSIHLKLVRQPAFVIDISKHWDTKRHSIECYESQFPHDAPSPTVQERIATSAAWWGNTIGRAYGEPFSSREPIGLSGFSNLL